MTWDDEYAVRLKYARDWPDTKLKQGINWPFLKALGVCAVICGAFWYVVAPKIWHVLYRIAK